MTRNVAQLLKRMKEENEKLADYNKRLKQQNMFLSTRIVDQRFTIDQMKKKLIDEGIY